MDSKFIETAVRRKYADQWCLREITLSDYEYRQRMMRESEIGSYYLRSGEWDESFTPDPLYSIVRGAHTRRIDLLMLDSAHKFTAVEIKVSRADFFRDTYEKRAPWIRHTSRFVYATPQGLVQPSEVPDGCGLWEVDEYGSVKMKKRAKINHDPAPFPESFLRTVFVRLAMSESRSV